MKIWYISKYASPVTRHFYLSEEWAKEGHEVCVITSNKDSKKNTRKYLIKKIKGFNVVWLKTYVHKKSNGLQRIIGWIHFEWQLFSFSKKNLFKPDAVIISSLSLLTLINAYRFSKKYNAKLIFEVRDIWPMSAIILGNFSRYHPFILFLAWIERFGYKKADAIVGTMPNLTEHVTNIIGNQNKTYCIPQGLNLNFYNKNEYIDQEYIDDYIPKDKFIIMYTGTLNVNNPLHDLIIAAHKLKEHNIHIMIVGEGYEKSKLEKMASTTNNVSFPPYVPKAKVAHLLSFADVCYDAFESKLAKYGLSRNKWIDYMYAGKPIICSYSGYKSMINEANSGTFVPYGNVEKLIETILFYIRLDNKIIKEMGEKGKAFLLENRTFDILASDYLKIINKS